MTDKKRMVIDASVAMTAGDSKNVNATRCRDFLKTFLKEGFVPVMTNAIYEEWHDPDPVKAARIAIAKRWYTQFRRAKIVWLTDEVIRDDELRQLIQAASHYQRIMQDDVHLIEAAQATDQTIISCDETAREPFSQLCQQAPALKEILWENPTRQPAVNLWLKNGASPDPERKLGYPTKRK
ncbi:MAG: hypothetical protein MUF87_10975 [Anaerolineae bacterium]|jgi:predicted nucleic acid-binding protein|nr:hypothetical protein [Anaerolineae bacterium]